MAQVNDGTAKWELYEIANQSDVNYIENRQSKFPAWWLYRGTGADGVYTPSNGSSFKYGNYTNITINSGVTVNIYRFTVMVCNGTFTLNGTINGQGKGGIGGAYISKEGATYVSNPGEAGSFAASGSNGTGGGCYATAFGYAKYTGALPNDVLNRVEYFPTMPIIMGGGGSSGYDGNKPGNAGGNGGAGLIVLAKKAVLNGTINCSGNSGNHAENAGGDGGGGGILIIADTISGSGTFTHTGGYAGWHKTVSINNL